MQISAVRQVASGKTEALGRLHHLRINEQDTLYITADHQVSDVEHEEQ